MISEQVWSFRRPDLPETPTTTGIVVRFNLKSFTYKSGGKGDCPLAPGSDGSV